MTRSILGRAISEAATPLAREIAQRAEPIVDRYARDPYAHIEDGHVWIQDLETVEPVPLRPYDHQIEFAETWIDLDHLVRRGTPRFRNVHEEKSRQMGMTWWIAYLSWWLLSYHALPGLYVNMSGADVDDGGSASTTDSFFGRIRFIHEYDARDPETGDRRGIPPHLRAALEWRQAPESVIRNRQRPGSFLIGEKATPNPGRGGRYAWGVLDECARIPWAKSVRAAVRSAIPEGRVYVSTPNGQDALFYGTRKARPRNFEFLRHHWSEHPVYGRGLHTAGAEPKRCDLCRATEEGVEWTPEHPIAHRYPGKLTSPWYDEAVLDLDDETVAAELDIDYTGSLPARVYPQFQRETHVIEAGIPYDPHLKLELAWDYGTAAATAVLIYQEGPYELRQIGEVWIQDTDPGEVDRALRETLSEMGVDDRTLAVSAAIQGVGDPAGEARQLATGRSLVSDYRKLGWTIYSKRSLVVPGINAVRRVLAGRAPKPLRISGPDCPRTVESFENHKWPTDREGNRKPGATQPQRDRWSHACDAARYYLAWKFPLPEAADQSTAATPEEDDRWRHDRGLSSDMGF